MDGRLAFGFAILSFAFVTTARSYGPIGHEIVGAIADERLANTSTGAKVRQLLDGITLKKASVIADEIRGWDKNGPDDLKAFHYSRHPRIDAQLTDFWRANPPTKDPNATTPSHYWFHYTDVPVVRPEKYEDGAAGRSKWDIVHMIAYCVDVLRGRIPEQNERKITKPIAVILLSHFVGDIHQPLHVGAEYFDNSGRVADPDKYQSTLADEGGNTFTFELIDDPRRGRGIHKRNFHVFWDLDTVTGLLPIIPPSTSKQERRALVNSAEQNLVHDMATHEPKNWNMPAGTDLSRYAQNWANEILPTAREAHERLIFKDVAATMEEDKLVAAGELEEKPGSPIGDYRKWATDVVRDELHKAGWRLADLLEKSLSTTDAKPPGANTTAPSPQSSHLASLQRGSREEENRARRQPDQQSIVWASAAADADQIWFALGPNLSSRFFCTK